MSLPFHSCSEGLKQTLICCLKMILLCLEFIRCIFIEGTVCEFYLNVWFSAMCKRLLFAKPPSVWVQASNLGSSSFGHLTVFHWQENGKWGWDSISSFALCLIPCSIWKLFSCIFHLLDDPQAFPKDLVRAWHSTRFYILYSSGSQPWGLNRPQLVAGLESEEPLNMVSVHAWGQVYLTRGRGSKQTPYL